MDIKADIKQQEKKNSTGSCISLLAFFNYLTLYCLVFNPGVLSNNGF